MRKFKDYNEYLCSDKWVKIKEDFKAQNTYDESCFLCYNVDHLQLHHWRYPKDWNRDSYKNLIQVCSSCHDIIHNTKLYHDSHHYDRLDKYLSHLIKDFNVMDIIGFESLCEEF